MAGGVCNSAGGALVRRGPAYTEAAIYAQVDATGELRLINELGIDLGRDPEEQLEKLERGDFTRIVHDMHEKRCSAADYVEQVRDVAASSPARYNGNPRYLKGAAGSAGRVVVFGLRLDTFPEAKGARVFHLATEDAAVLSEVRLRLLGEASLVAVAAEYMHRGLFRLAAIYGKGLFLATAMLGAGRLPMLFRMKAAIDDIACSLGRGDAWLWLLSWRRQRVKLTRTPQTQPLKPNPTTASPQARGAAVAGGAARVRGVHRLREHNDWPAARAAARHPLRQPARALER